MATVWWRGRPTELDRDPPRTGRATSTPSGEAGSIRGRGRAPSRPKAYGLARLLPARSLLSLSPSRGRLEPVIVDWQAEALEGLAGSTSPFTRESRPKIGTLSNVPQSPQEEAVST